MSEIKLTEYSHGAGCGCKLASSVLDKIISSTREVSNFPNLLVANTSNDDAAAFDLGNGTSVLSTTDFFMPIVDDPFTFGKIAATNAISDIFAMGGKPLMAIAILGWPIDKLPPEVANQVIEGGRSVCSSIGIPIAGGHSIDSAEPIFGLAVTGLAHNEDLKMNNKAEPDCQIFLTKPIGVGILTTAQKRKKIQEDHLQVAIDSMCRLNEAGYDFAKIKGLTALTDVTGFGLLGHLLEVCESSNVSAVIEYSKVPLLPNVEYYHDLGCVSGGTKKNFKSYGNKLSEMPEQVRNILCDAQTSGGLLAIVKNDSVEEFKSVAQKHGLNLQSIGYTSELTEPIVTVRI